MQNRISDNTRPHQLCWGDWKMGTAISCTKCSQVAGLIHVMSLCSRTSKVYKSDHIVMCFNSVERCQTGNNKSVAFLTKLLTNNVLH